MKKSLKIVLVLVVIIALALGIILIIKSGQGPDVPDVPVISGDQEEMIELSALVAIRDVPFSVKTDNRNIDCVYPAITSLSNKEFQNYINTEIAQNIQAYREEIEFVIDEDTPVTALYSYITSYERYNCGNYLSLVIDQNYQTGGIRSDKWKDIYNINAKTERLFYLDELFEAGVDYESAIIHEITKQAQIKNYELMGGNGLTKLPTKQKFYIKDDKLIIYFDPSEAAATVFGELHFEMPFAINENGYFEI